MESYKKPKVVDKPLEGYDKDDLLSIVLGAPLDDKVGIRHTRVTQGEEYNLHVAEIQEKVNPHVHFHGDETYYTLKGSGRMYTGKVVEKSDGTYEVRWDYGNIIELKEGETFVIPAGYAHSLKNTGEKPLVIAFECPDEHLDKDRVLIDKLPDYKKADYKKKND